MTSFVHVAHRFEGWIQVGSSGQRRKWGSEGRKWWMRIDWTRCLSRMAPDRKAWRTSRMGAQACFKHREHLGCFCENWALLFFLFSSAGVPLHKQLHQFSSEISWVSKSTRPKSRFKGSCHSASQWPLFVRQSRLAVFLADQRKPETLQDRNMTILEFPKSNCSTESYIVDVQFFVGNWIQLFGLCCEQPESFKFQVIRNCF